MTGDRGAAAPSAVTHFCMDVQVNLPEICPGSSDHRWTLPLPSNENHLPGTTPPSSRPLPLLPPTSRAETGGREGRRAGPSSHSEAPTAGPRTMIGGAYGRCLEGPATPGRDVSASTRGFSPVGPLPSSGLGICASSSAVPAGSAVVGSRGRRDPTGFCSD